MLEHECNIMFVCEHWLKPSELYEVQSTFSKQGMWSNLKSSTPADAVLQGRPYGGTGFICKTIQHCTFHDVPQEDGRISVIEVLNNNRVVITLIVLSYKRGNEMRFTRFNVVSPLHCLIWINLLFR